MEITVKGFIQYFSVEPFTMGLQTQKDIELYHEGRSFSPLFCDATGKVCANVNGKSIFYYTYVPQEYDLKVEPTPVCQILTDCQDETPLILCLERFTKPERKRFGFKVKTVPPLFICGVPWLIIKTAQKVFNNEILPQYIDRCFNIVTGNALYTLYLSFTFYETGFKKCQETHKKFKYPFCYVFDQCASQYQRPVNVFWGFKQIFEFITEPY